MFVPFILSKILHFRLNNFPCFDDNLFLSFACVMLSVFVIDVKWCQDIQLNIFCCCFWSQNSFVISFVSDSFGVCRKLPAKMPKQVSGFVDLSDRVWTFANGDLVYRNGYDCDCIKPTNNPSLASDNNFFQPMLSDTNNDMNNKRMNSSNKMTQNFIHLSTLKTRTTKSVMFICVWRKKSETNADKGRPQVN